MASPETYRYKPLVKARKEWITERVIKRRRYLALRSDGYILRKDTTYTPQGWRSPGWKHFRKKSDASPWPEFAKEFTARLHSYGYRVFFMGDASDLTAHGFSTKLRQELTELKRMKGISARDGEEPMEVSGTIAEVKAREKSRYRLWVCPKCSQKVRAGTDSLRITCTGCQRAFVRKD